MKIVSVFLAVVLMVAVASIALARGAPAKQKAFSHQSVSVDAVTPIVALRNVPPMTTGYDVICNLAQAAKIVSADTSARSKLSATVDWRGFRTNAYLTRSGPQPALVLLA